MEFDAEDLKEFIRSVIKSVKSSIESEGCGFASPIEFELAIVKTKNKDVGFNIRVVDASSKHGDEVVSKVKFSTAKKGSRFERDPESVRSQRELEKEVRDAFKQ